MIFRDNIRQDLACSALKKMWSLVPEAGTKSWTSNYIQQILWDVINLPIYLPASGKTQCYSFYYTIVNFHYAFQAACR